METNETKILAYLYAHEEEILEDLKALVDMDSPTADKNLAEKCADVLEEVLQKRLGKLGTVTTFPQEQYGRHILFSSQSKQQSRIVLTGHYDTVWEKDAIAPFHLVGDELHGPGVLDMKSGDIFMIWALKALWELDIPLNKGVELFFTSDEEVSGPTSRPLMDKLFQGYRAALVIEPGEEETGRIATRAPGNCRFKLDFIGRSAHAGAAHRKGINAIEEMAYQIIKLQAMTDYSRGLTMSVGVCSGGEAVNIVPDKASCLVDCRFLIAEDGEMLRQLFSSLKPEIPGCSIQVEEICYLGPVEKTPENDALFRQLQDAGAAVGYPIQEFTWGASSDANYFAMLGIPVLCSLGGNGSGIHARHEYVKLSELIPRLAVLTSLLTRL